MLGKKLATTLSLIPLLFPSAYARLHIINNSSVDPVFAKCTGKIPPVTIMHDYPINLAWKAIEAILEGPQGSCVFYDKNTIVANASIRLSDDSNVATITEFNLYIPNVTVLFTPPLGTPSRDIYASVINKN